MLNPPEGYAVREEANFYIVFRPNWKGESKDDMVKLVPYGQPRQYRLVPFKGRQLSKLDYERLEPWVGELNA